MLSTHRSLVRTQQPALKQGGDAMNAGHADMGRITGVGKNNLLVSVTALRQFRDKIGVLLALSQNWGHHARKYWDRGMEMPVSVVLFIHNFLRLGLAICCVSYG